MVASSLQENNSASLEGFRGLYNEIYEFGGRLCNTLNDFLIYIVGLMTL